MASLKEPLSGPGTVKLGPFVSEADGKTTMDGSTPSRTITIAQADVQLSKNNGAFAQKHEATSAVHDEKGWYDITLDATDLAPEYSGHLLVAIDVHGALPVSRKFAVEVPAP